MALAGMDILLNLPFQLAAIIISKDSYLPWVSWEYTHYGEWDQFFERLPDMVLIPMP